MNINDNENNIESIDPKYYQKVADEKSKLFLPFFKENDFIANSAGQITNRSYTPKVKLPDIFKAKPKSAPDAELVKDMPIYTATVMGHVDHGKSTLLGRLLQQCGRIKSHVIEGYREEAKLKQKATFEFAWALDTTAAEREKGVTIDNSFKEFNTQNRYFTMIDSPGHRDYLKNSLNAIMQADIAILAMAANVGIPTSSVAREHLKAAKASGVSAIIIALTKMDLIPLQQRASVYMQRTREIRKYLHKLNWPSDRIYVVPINSLKDPGWNIIKNNPKELPFYKGPTLVEAIDTIELDPVRSDLPLRLAVDEILTGVPGTNIVVTGKVLTGNIKPGAKVLVTPGNHPATVRTVTMHHQEVLEGATNCSVGVDLTNITADKLRRGSILSAVDSPAKTVSEITCDKVTLTYHPSALRPNANVIAHYLTGHVTLKVKEIKNLYESEYQGDYNDQAKPENERSPMYKAGIANELKVGETATVVFQPETPLVMETCDTNPKMSNLVIRDQDKTLAVTKITSLVSKF